MDLRNAIVHQDDVDWIERAHGAGIAFRRKLLGDASGAEQLGCSLFEVAPGKRAWPFHYHFANEEALYILEGAGTLRLGAQQHQVRAGHFVTFRVGADHAHQLINTGSVTLRYICFSTMTSPEVGGYPDSGKLGIIVGRRDGSGRAGAMRKYFKEASEVDYYEGEK